MEGKYDGIVEKLWRELCGLAVGESYSYNFGDDKCARDVGMQLAVNLINSTMLGEFKVERLGRNLTVRRINEGRNDGRKRERPDRS